MLARSFVLAILAVALTAGPGRTQSDIASLGDPFTDAARLKEWKRLAAEEGFPSMVRDIGLYEETGCLHLEPGTSFWMRDFRAPFLFKEVEGDFVVTVRELVRGKKFPAPAARWSLAGLMVRAPREITAENWTAGGENWLSLMMGLQSKIRGTYVEVRNTVDSQTDLSSLPIEDWSWMELRIVRAGSSFVMLARAEGSDWQVVQRASRPDLPTRLQVGLTACTDWMSAMRLHNDPVTFNTEPFDGTPDLEAMFDYVTFSRPSLPDGTDPASLATDAVDEAQILKLFASDS